MNDGILLSTEELYHRYLSGEKVKDISIKTGLSKWTIYKRFQRLRKTRQQMITQAGTQNDDAKEMESTEQTILESENSDWEENILAGILSFMTVFLGIFLYRKYDEEIMIELKKILQK